MPIDRDHVALGAHVVVACLFVAEPAANVAFRLKRHDFHGDKVLFSVEVALDTIDFQARECVVLVELVAVSRQDTRISVLCRAELEERNSG